jgi:hypothetical protein
MVNSVSARFQFLGTELVPFRVLVVVGTHLRVAVETERNSVLFIVRPALQLVHNMSSLNVRAALFEAEAT